MTLLNDALAVHEALEQLYRENDFPTPLEEFNIIYLALEASEEDNDDFDVPEDEDDDFGEFTDAGGVNPFEVKEADEAALNNAVNYEPYTTDTRGQDTYLADEFSDFSPSVRTQEAENALRAIVGRDVTITPELANSMVNSAYELLSKHAWRAPVAERAYYPANWSGSVTGTEANEVAPTEYADIQGVDRAASAQYGAERVHVPFSGSTVLPFGGCK